MSRWFSLLAVCVLIVATAAAPRRVFAYSDVDFFGITAPGGGGGGRHFTGSPVDGYTCAACHEGGTSPAIRVLGLPLAGYKQGGSYEITIDWSDCIEHFAAAVELTDMTGKRAGKLRLPATDERQDPELCEATIALGADVVRVPPEDMATQLGFCGGDKGVLPVDCRQVVHVRSCGSQRLRFLWSAPVGNFGPIWFSGAAVAADNDGSDRGDGVAEFAQVLTAAGEEIEVEAGSAGCGVATRPGAPGHAWLWFTCLLGLGLARRRSRNVRMPRL